MLNSPNPVDGDVQAMIALALRISAMPLKKVSETVFCPSLYSSVSTAEIHGIATALVKLSHGFTSKAEKITEHSGCGRGTQIDMVTVRMKPGEVIVKMSEADYKRLSTTPPAQLLRPVELPHAYSPALSSVLKNSTDGVAVMRCDKGGKWVNKTAVIEALRQQGIEVKND